MHEQFNQLRLFGMARALIEQQTLPELYEEDDYRGTLRLVGRSRSQRAHNQCANSRLSSWCVGAPQLTYTSCTSELNPPLLIFGGSQLINI